ncbi:restriction endonuclease subunit S [Klebsiella oxytoca]
MVDLMVSEQQSGMVGKGVPAGFKLTEVGVIPEDWEVKTINEIAKVYSGGTPNRKIAQYWDGDIPWVTTTLIDGNDISDVDEYITYNGLKNSSAKWCDKNTLLMAMYGQGKTRGKVGVLRIKATINQACAAISLYEKTSVKYLFHYLNSKYVEIRELSNSGGQENLSGTIIKNLPIPYPSDKERLIIADTLSDIDTFILAQERLLAKKQAIKTATMQQLLTGKTRLPQFALRDDGTTKGYKKSELGDIPEDWDISTYGQVFSFLSTSTNARSDLSDTGECGYIHYGDIHTKWNNNLNLENSSVPRISSYLVSSSFIEDGDLIMADASEDYAGIGKSIEIQGVRDNIIVAGLHTYLLRDVNNIFVDGFRGYLHCIRAVKANIDRLATGMKVFGVSKNNLKTIPIPVPPKEEQIAIAAILSDMDKDIQTLQRRLDKTRQLKQGMMQELLTGKTRLI